MKSGAQNLTSPHYISHLREPEVMITYLSLINNNLNRYFLHMIIAIIY